MNIQGQVHKIGFLRIIDKRINKCSFSKEKEFIQHSIEVVLLNQTTTWNHPYTAMAKV
jgi:hypothetical protein